MQEKWPTTQVFRLKNGVAPDMPDYLYVHDEPDAYDLDDLPYVAIVTGPLTDKPDGASIKAIKAKLQPYTLLIAVMEGTAELLDEENYPATPEHSEFRKTCNAMFVVPKSEVEQVCKSVALTITKPLGSNHIGTDINDVIWIVSQGGCARYGRYGYGKGSGDSRASQAAQDAVRQIEQQKYALRDAFGLLVVISGPRNIKGAEVKEIMRHLRAHGHAGLSIAQGIQFVDSMPEDAIDVSVTVFGEAPLSR